jgi:hypothetical protein
MEQSNAARLLPADMRAKAVLSGRELAWRREDVFHALRTAHENGLAFLGGQVQFVFPEGTCELYWLNFDPADRMPAEPWPAYVRRTYVEADLALHRLLDSVDMKAEAVNAFEFLRTKDLAGEDVLAHLVFVCYFHERGASDCV